MSITYSKFGPILLVTTVLTTLLYFSLSGVVKAHEIAGPIDPVGNVPSFTAVAMVTCYDDGNGPADYLIANIKDLPSNPAVEGMFVNMTLFKGSKAISVTDVVPGDDNPSQFIKLSAGNGVYFMIVSKTKAGARNVFVDYHCMTANNVHTGTDIALSHYE
ncbi:hypothetical protein SAMN05421880_10455 [Nitrosomonas nitrosa]|uniref:Uncharacterized protein n=1 Tax=Nitrosomonas nitrosa TaxID=52442 RepID=A0A1I4MEI1_9PROT|nr:hypothetical protein [Nitrosomonas nitrosa]SFM01832.1 hypothetical protein SAMN05421880_10455 [Nitrosomonas nitrosa]